MLEYGRPVEFVFLRGERTLQMELEERENIKKVLATEIIIAQFVT